MFLSARRISGFVLLALAVGTLLTGCANHVSGVHTVGVSMEPLIHTGDNIVFAKSDTYNIGQVIAYVRADDGMEIVHRIIGGDETGYVVKGDHNSLPDPARPTASQIIGHEIIHTHYPLWWVIVPIVVAWVLGIICLLVPLIPLWRRLRR